MSVVILDVETTGLTEPRLVEAAYGVLRQDWIFERTFVQRYRPGKPIEYGAMATHGITETGLTGCPPASQFRLPDDVEYLIGHNIDYDYNVVCGCGPQPNPKRICTLALSRMCWPTLDSHKQLALLYYHDPIEARFLHREAHRAETDIQITRIILSYIIDHLGSTDWQTLYQKSEQARIPTHMPFGKHKGVKIADVPADYIRWLLQQPDVDPYLGRALRGERG